MTHVVSEEPRHYVDQSGAFTRPGEADGTPHPGPEPVSVIIPAYNEREGIARTVNAISSVLSLAEITHEIIVVDDGSTDRTAEAAERTSATVVSHTSNRGYGAALKTGILTASHEVICIIDADGTYPPGRIPDLLAALDTADMVVGARTGTSVAIPFGRRPAKWVLNQLANFVTCSKIPDLNSGLRAFRRGAALQYFHILPDQFSFTTTITMAMHADRYAVTYLPIDYGRRTGKSKIVPWDAATFASLILRTAMFFRPLRVFLPSALICLLYALLKGAWDILVTGHPNISATAAVAMISAVQLTLIGMLGDAIATRLWHLGEPAYGGIRSVRFPRARNMRIRISSDAPTGRERIVNG
jgi:glycosyltransferase involved in cell wall biosynthesis